MAYFANQGRGRNLAISIESDRGGPYGIMTVFVPIVLAYAFEPPPGEKVPATEGTPEWTDADQSSFQDKFQKQVSVAWRRKFPIYGRRDEKAKEHANSRTIGFLPYATVKVDVEVELRFFEAEKVEKCTGGGCVGDLNVNVLFVLRAPKKKRFRPNCSDETRAGFVYEDDVNAKVLHGFGHVTAAHEVGHLMGFDHIGMNEPGCQYDPTGHILFMSNRGNADACYMEHGTWSDNIMGCGMTISRGQYDVFGRMLTRIMQDYEWSVESYTANIPIGNDAARGASGGK